MPRAMWYVMRETNGPPYELAVSGPHYYAVAERELAAYPPEVREHLFLALDPDTEKEKSDG